MNKGKVEKLTKLKIGSSQYYQYVGSLEEVQAMLDKAKDEFENPQFAIHRLRHTDELALYVFEGVEK